MNKIPMGRRVCLATEVESTLTKAQGGGWTYPGVAQFYKMVNDRLMYFFPNSGAKTIKERVPRKAIKLHNGHPGRFMMSAPVRETVGYVLSAEERQSAMRYVGFVSSSEQEIADKLTDGTITENSMELITTAAVDKAVAVEMVPKSARPFVSLNSDGDAVVLGVKEYIWMHLGLVSSSSQDRNAILGPPTMVALSGMPATRSEWDPAAAQAALNSWAGTFTAAGAREVPNYAKLGCAYLCQFGDSNGDIILAGQIAVPDDTGKLVVNTSAIAPALDDLSRQLARSGLPAEAQVATLDAAFERVKPYLLPATPLLTAGAVGDSSQTGAGDGAAATTGDTVQAAVLSGAEKPSDADSQKAAGPAQPPTVGSEEVDSSTTNAHLELAGRIEALRCKLRYPRVVHESAKPSREPAAEGSPGA